MDNILEYKGFTGTIEFSDEDSIYYGKVQNVEALILYEGKTIEELNADFHNAIIDYLTLCEARKN